MVGLGAEHHGILLQPEHRVEDEHVVRVHYNKICMITRLELETDTGTSPTVAPKRR